MRKLIFFAFILCYLSAALSYADIVTLTWPDDYDIADDYIGCEVEFNQTLYVSDNSSWNKYGEVTLSGERLMSPTDIALPGSDDYRSIVTANNRNRLILSDGSNDIYPEPRPWANQDGTLRTGAKLTYLRGILSYTKFGYTVTPTQEPEFLDNVRPVDVETLGDHDIRICSFNLQFYLASHYGEGYGPENEAQAELQHSKILKALLAIDADVFGLLEIQQGNGAQKRLVAALNEARPDARYAYVEDGVAENGTFTKAGFIYRSDKLTPLRQIQMNNSVVKYRKFAQGFEVVENGEKFVCVLCHFKSKSGSGSGDNADSGDGQGAFNGDRVKEATAVVTFAKSTANYFGDPDVIIMGDLNAYAMEDPIRILEEGGYHNLLKYFGGEGAYSYSFRGTAGCLDHILANGSIMSAITGCSAFHLNADEPTVFGYAGYSAQDNMYRSSDHDPVVVGLDFSMQTVGIDSSKPDNYIVYGKDGIIGIAGGNGGGKVEIFTSTGMRIYTENNIDADFTIDVNSLSISDGVYVVRLTISDNQVIISKMIVAK